MLQYRETPNSLAVTSFNSDIRLIASSKVLGTKVTILGVVQAIPDHSYAGKLENDQVQ